MADNREASWRDDHVLRVALEKYVQQGLKRSEIIDFMLRDFAEYPWSISSLDRQLRHFKINYNDKTVPVQDVITEVENMLSGPGRLLGYRAMHKKIRQEYNKKASRQQVYLTMQELDPSGLTACSVVGAKKQRMKGYFTSRGSNWVHSLDGHDKLMVYQNSTYPLAIYGCIDTASPQTVIVEGMGSNCDPKLIGHWYLEYLFETRRIASMLRVGRGTATGAMTAMHVKASFWTD